MRRQYVGRVCSQKNIENPPASRFRNSLPATKPHIDNRPMTEKEKIDSENLMIPETFAAEAADSLSAAKSFFRIRPKRKTSPRYSARLFVRQTKSADGRFPDRPRSESKIFLNPHFPEHLAEDENGNNGQYSGDDERSDFSE